MPVEVKKFRLESGITSLDFVVDNQALVNIVSHYSLWEQSFEGIYQVKADKFIYEDIQFTKVELKGNFKGVAEDIYVDGKGTVLDGEADYSLNIIDDVAQKILLNLKSAQIAELLQLYGQPALAEGKIDIEINMPNIGEDTATGYGHIVLNKAFFNRQRIETLYDYTLPENSYVHGTIDAKLAGKEVKLLGDVQSNLFMLQIKNGLIDTVSKKLTAEYSLDVKDMRILTKNKLAGPLKAEGTLERKDKTLHFTGTSHSLGGVLQFSVDETIQITLEKLALEKLLPLFKQPVYAQGEVSGTIAVDKENKQDGTYILQIDKGVLSSKALEQMSRYQLPLKNTFSLASKGKIADKKLTAKTTTIHSTLADVTLFGLGV